VRDNHLEQTEKKYAALKEARENGARKCLSPEISGELGE